MFTEITVLAQFGGCFIDSAEIYLNQALTAYESHYGSGNEKVLEIKDELARLLIRTDRVEVRIVKLYC